MSEVNDDPGTKPLSDESIHALEKLREEISRYKVVVSDVLIASVMGGQFAIGGAILNRLMSALMDISLQLRQYSALEGSIIDMGVPPVPS